ncbi:hypothetical protein RJT34_18267 [Clitoria ternatea]|uniref:Uncharacterized protein n=1 Tax=Clitoria ternatea TaxID=43366 RepID=A0AAN9JAH0_CLITE
MAISFCAGGSASTAHTWTTLSGTGADDVRVMTRKSVDGPKDHPLLFSVLLLLFAFLCHPKESLNSSAMIILQVIGTSFPTVELSKKWLSTLPDGTIAHGGGIGNNTTHGGRLLTEALHILVDTTLKEFDETPNCHASTLTALVILLDLYFMKSNSISFFHLVGVSNQ